MTSAGDHEQAAQAGTEKVSITAPTTAALRQNERLLALLSASFLSSLCRNKNWRNQADGQVRVMSIPTMLNRHRRRPQPLSLRVSLIPAGQFLQSNSFHPQQEGTAHSDLGPASSQTTTAAGTQYTAAKSRVAATMAGDWRCWPCDLGQGSAAVTDHCVRDEDNLKPRKAGDFSSGREPLLRRQARSCAPTGTSYCASSISRAIGSLRIPHNSGDPETSLVTFQRQEPTRPVPTRWPLQRRHLPPPR